MREGPHVQPHRPQAEQVVGQPRQLGDDDADVLAAPGRLDPQQLLDRLVPGDVVGHRRDVVHAVGDGDVLVVVQRFAELLEAGVQVADVGHGLDDPLAFQLQHQPQGGVRGRMLGAEVHRPQVRLRLVLGEVLGEYGAAQGHDGGIRDWGLGIGETGCHCWLVQQCSRC